MTLYDNLTLGYFLVSDPILLAMHHHQQPWGDLLCDDFHDWKENIATLCAPALKEVAAIHAAVGLSTDPSPSRVASPLFVEPSHAAFPPFTDPVAMEPAVERLFAAARASRSSSPLTVSVALLMASAHVTPLFMAPVAQRVAPVAQRVAPVAQRVAPVAQRVEPVAQKAASGRPPRAPRSPLFIEPIPTPVAEVKHAYFATNSTIVPAEPSPFAPQAPPVDGIKTIIVRNLPRTISPEELRERFQLYGVVRDVYLPRNKDPNSIHHGTIRGFALIKYDTAVESDRAVRVLSALGLSIREKKVTVEFAKSDTAAR